MNFLYPAFLLGALAIAIPIALHLLRRDVAPDLPFTAVRLLKKSPVERSRRRRLRDILLLAARVAALLLLAVAFARPFAPASASAMQALRIVAIDTSFSMTAPGRFDRAVALAAAAIDEAGFGERVALLAFDERATVLSPPGAAADARTALRAVRPGSGATRFASAITKASELATDGVARLVLISDLQRAGWEGQSRIPVPASLTVEARDAGVPLANAAIVGARVDAQGVVASVRNASGAERNGTVVLTRDGAELARATYMAAAHTTVDVFVFWTPVAGGVTLSILDDDGFAADDTRHLIVGAPASAAVLVVTSPDATGFYLQRALEAAQEDGTDLQPRLVTAAQIAGGRAQAIASHRAVVLLSTRTLDRPAREAITAFVRGGGGLLVAAAPDVDPGVVAGMFDWNASRFAADTGPRDASLTATDSRHPIFRPFGGLAANLGQVRFTRAWRVAPEGWHVAAHFDDGSPAVLERPEGQGRVVLFASDLDRRWNDFPLHPSFVPFVVESIRHVAARRTERDHFVVGRVPAGFVASPGIHRLASGRLVAVNVDPRESATGGMTPDEFAAMLEPVQQASSQQTAREEQTESRQNLWQFGILLMIVTLVAESFVGRA
jgi:hypothetical protein